MSSITEGMNKAQFLTETRTYKLWESAGQKIMEAQLTADQINQLFANIEQGATAAGGNRTVIGKGKDVASAVNKAWEDLKTKASNSGPIKNMDAMYDQAAEKLKQATGGDQGVMKYVQKYRDFANKHPVAQSLIYGALIAAAGITGAGVGGAAALGLFKMVDKLLQGEKFSSAAYQGAKTGALAYGASKLGDLVTGRNTPVTAKSSKTTWDAVDQGFAKPQGAGGGLSGGRTTSGSDTWSATLRGVTGDQIRNHPDYATYIQRYGDTVNGRRMAQMAVKNAMARAQSNESVELNEETISVLFTRIDEGLWDTIKGKAAQVGKNLTTKVTADKLMSAWKKAGSPTDHIELWKLLVANNIPEPLIKSTFSSMGIGVKKKATGKIAAQTTAQQPTSKEPASSEPLTFGGEKYTKGPKGWINSKGKPADINTTNILNKASTKATEPVAKTAPTTSTQPTTTQPAMSIKYKGNPVGKNNLYPQMKKDQQEKEQDWERQASGANESKKDAKSVMPTPRQVPAPPGGHPVPPGYERVKSWGGAWELRKKTSEVVDNDAVDEASKAEIRTSLDQDVKDFLAKGGEIEKLKPNKVRAKPGMGLASKHIGTAGEINRKTRSKMLVGKGRNVHGNKPVVNVEGVDEDTSYAGGMGQGGNAGQSYRKFKPKSAGTNEEQATMFTPEEKMVNANDTGSDGWHWYKPKPAGIAESLLEYKLPYKMGKQESDMQQIDNIIAQLPDGLDVSRVWYFAKDTFKRLNTKMNYQQQKEEFDKLKYGFYDVYKKTHKQTSFLDKAKDMVGLEEGGYGYEINEDSLINQFYDEFLNSNYNQNSPSYLDTLKNLKGFLSHKDLSGDKLKFVMKKLIQKIKPELEEDQIDELKCWPGYTRVRGIPAGAPGSCKKKTKESSIMKGLQAEEKIEEYKEVPSQRKIVFNKENPPDLYYLYQQFIQQMLNPENTMDPNVWIDKVNQFYGLNYTWKDYQKRGHNDQTNNWQKIVNKYILKK